MIMGSNQPYFIPYIGYWQLINSVDVFVIEDDYNYIKRGWVNRNQILENGKGNFFNIELSHASQNSKINELFLSDTFQPQKKLQRLQAAYKKAPFFEDGYALMRQILEYDNINLADFLEHCIRCICDYLGIHTKLIRSSSIPNNSTLKREYRIYDQCKFVGADTYINAIGGQKLYSYQEFRNEGIKLGFIKTGDIQYKQFGPDFIPYLSIIDVIMFNSREAIKDILQQYTILWEEGAAPND